MLTPVQLSERIGVAKQTLANWRAMRVGPPSFKIGRLVRYWEADVNAWLGDAGRAEWNGKVRGKSAEHPNTTRH